MELVVEFEADSLDSVSVVSPDGSSFAERSVGAGISTVSVELGTDYTPGEFRVLGLSDGESVAETTLEIRPRLEIVEVGVGANNLARMPEGLGTMVDEEALVVVRNDGSGPQQIKQLAFTGDLPNPDPDPGDPNRSGIFDTSDGRGSLSSVLLPAGEQVVLFSSSLPFSFEGGGVDCGTEPTEGGFTVSISGGVGENAITEPYAISYGTSAEYDGCEISIQPVSR